MMIFHHQLSTVDSFWVTELVDSKSTPAWLFVKVNSLGVDLGLAMHISWICTASMLIWWWFLIIKSAQPIQSLKTLIWAISMVSQRKTSLRPPKYLYNWYQSLDINYVSKSHQGSWPLIWDLATPIYDLGEAIIADWQELCSSQSARIPETSIFPSGNICFRQSIGGSLWTSSMPWPCQLACEWYLVPFPATF